MTTETPKTETPKTETPKTLKPILQRLATTLTAISFVGVGLTGVFMSLGIGGRALNGLHTVVGIAFVAASVLHVIRNGKALMKLLARRSTQLVIAGGLVAMGVGLVISASTAPTRRGDPRGAFSRQAAQAAPASTQDLRAE